MQYNFHNEKYQMKDVVGIHREQFREIADQSKYRNNVDPSRTNQNVYDDLVPDGKDWYGAVKTAKENTAEKTGRKVRKDAVVLCSTVESVPPSWPQDVSTQYFRDKASWYDQFLRTHGGLDEGSMKSLVIHYDETTPHATYDWIPIKDGRLQAKNILTKELLQKLQDQGQKYSMEWIETYNQQHPDRQIERLELSGREVKRNHLDELSFKRMKGEEAIVQLEQRHAEITDDIAIASEALQNVRQDTSDQLEKQRQSEKKTAEAEKRYEVLVEKITGAPDLPSYEYVKGQNEKLKEELSFKDKLIERLQNSAQQWKEKAELWKERFMTVTRAFGAKLMRYAGYDVSDIQDYPSSEVSKGMKDLEKDSEKIDPASLRIVRDMEDADRYCVVFKDGRGAYETLKRGFPDRETAEEWRRNYDGYASSLCESLSDRMTFSANN